MITHLKPGECVLTNGSQVIRFSNLFDAAANAVNHYRSNRNGWHLYDDINIEYPDDKWAELASYLD